MAQSQGNTMQLAEILSDLVSLRVCVRCPTLPSSLQQASTFANTNSSVGPRRSTRSRIRTLKYLYIPIHLLA
jgi:hypothetical protein